MKVCSYNLFCINNTFKPIPSFETRFWPTKTGNVFSYAIWRLKSSMMFILVFGSVMTVCGICFKSTFDKRVQDQEYTLEN